MKILDLDMDYFMVDIASTPLSDKNRLDEDIYGGSVWTEERIIKFLEENLGLSKNNRIPGRIVVGHNESLFFWEELINKGILSDPFEVIHVDSHADLGLGCFSSSFLLSDFLSLKTETRRKIRDFEFDGKIEEINIGDYLLWAIAYRMISKITYCANPYGPKNDYIWDTFKDFQENDVLDKPVSNYIQLCCNTDLIRPQYNSSEHYKKKYLEGAIKDPEVELHIIPTIDDVSFKGDFDFAVLAQSPNYTPASADFIIDIFRDYIFEI